MEDSGEPVKTRNFETDAELDALIRAFETAAISREAWDHAGHVAVAFAYVDAYGEAEAVRRMRDALRHFAVVHKIVASPGRGYHETLTQVWMRLVAHAASEGDLGTSRHEAANAVVARFADRSVVKRHYSDALIASDEARGRFVEPDLEPLPSATSQPVTA